MEETYFMHRIQKENGTYSKGIEVHDTLDAAILSFWGRMKLAYGANPNITFVSCKITNTSGNVVSNKYDLAWYAENEEPKFFMHHIRKDGETISKDIDMFESFDAACAAYAAANEYGHGNTRHPNVTYTSNMITGIDGSSRMEETWIKPEEE